VREAVRDGVDEGLEDGFLVVADDEDFLDLRDIGDCAEAVLDNGVACDREEGLVKALAGIEWYLIWSTNLGQFHRQRPKPSASRRSSHLQL
jgi:hypothetical protein